MIDKYKSIKITFWNIIGSIDPRLHAFLFKNRIYVKYVISGGTGALVNLSTLSAFVELLGVHYLLASAVSFTLGYLSSFFMQKFFTFSDTAFEGMHKQMISYLGIAIANILVNISIVFVLVDLLGLWYLASQFISSALIAVESFFLYKLVVFKK